MYRLITVCLFICYLMAVLVASGCGDTRMYIRVVI